MTILDVVKGVAPKVDVEVPSVVFSSTDRTMIEMGVTANAAARQIARDYDWQILQKIATITGDGVQTEFPLPAAYGRMAKNATISGPSFTFRTTHQVTDFSEWVEMLSWSVDTWQPRWALFGGTINFMPVIPNLEVYRFPYISKWIVNGTQESFTADTDSFVLDEELLRLSMIWNWKADKGQEYSKELQDYQEAMDSAMFNDKGGRTAITSGRGYRFPTGQVFP